MAKTGAHYSVGQFVLSLSIAMIGSTVEPCWDKEADQCHLTINHIDRETPKPQQRNLQEFDSNRNHGWCFFNTHFISKLIQREILKKSPMDHSCDL